jgi:hypothetical protein
VNLRARLERARRRLDLHALGRIAQSALVAGLAWKLALHLPGTDSRSRLATPDRNRSRRMRVWTRRA